MMSLQTMGGMSDDRWRIRTVRGEKSCGMVARMRILAKDEIKSKVLA